MTTRQSPPTDRYHLPLSDRITLARGAGPAWAGATWNAWKDELDDDATIDTYRKLRRSCEGKERFSNVNDLKRAVRVSYATLMDALADLELLAFIVVEKARGTINSIVVNQVPPVPAPEEMAKLRRRRARYRRPAPTTQDVKAFLRYWSALYEERRKVPYNLMPGKDATLVRGRMTIGWSLQRLQDLAWYLLVKGVGADVIPYDRVSIGKFVEKLNEIAAEKAADEQPSARIR